MRYSLHPEAAEDLREAGEFYRERAGTNLSQSFLTEFERSVSMLLEHPGLGAMWRHGKRRYLMRRFPYLAHLHGFGRRDPHSGGRAPQPPSWLLARPEVIEDNTGDLPIATYDRIIGSFSRCCFAQSMATS